MPWRRARPRRLVGQRGTGRALEQRGAPSAAHCWPTVAVQAAAVAVRLACGSGSSGRRKRRAARRAALRGCRCPRRAFPLAPMRPAAADSAAVRQRQRGAAAIGAAAAAAAAPKPPPGGRRRRARSAGAAAAA
jgi:hypothetical protein